MQNKNILVIVGNLPWPLHHGGDQAMFNGIDCIRNNYNVYCVYRGGIKNKYYKEKKCLEKIWGNVKIYPYIENDKMSTFWGFFNHVVNKLKKQLFSKNEQYKVLQIVEKFRLHPASFYDYINQLIVDLHIDIVQIEMVNRMNLVLGLPDNVKKVFVHHELRFVMNDLAISQSPHHSHFEQACAATAKMLEIGVLNHYDAVITLSETDKAKLEEAGVNVPIFTSMAVVNTKSNSNLHSDDCYVLTYCGPESHSPNYLAVKWFLKNCWDKLKSKDSKYIFRIIGKWSEPTIKRIQQKYKDVEFTGFVDDLPRTLLDTISIVPLTQGSGIRMKILEATTIGVPFVSTSIGAEGLPFKDGENCFITDDPRTFVNDILALRDKDLRVKFILSANKIVKSEYSLEALRKNREVVYEHLL